MTQRGAPRPTTALDTLLLNLMLAIAWMALTGMFTALNFIVGLVLAYFCIRILYRGRSTTTYLTSVRKTLAFFLFFMWQVIRANIYMMFAVLERLVSGQSRRLRPAVVAIPLDVRRDLSITLLANVITLTPGTLTLDVSDDKRTLYVHTAYVPEDVDAFRHEIKDGFERRIKDWLE